MDIILNILVLLSVLMTILTTGTALTIFIIEPGFLSSDILSSLANYSSQGLSFPLGFVLPDLDSSSGALGCSKFDDEELSALALSSYFLQNPRSTSDHAIFVLECENVGLLASNFGAGLSLPVIKSVPALRQHPYRFDSLYFRSTVFRPFFETLRSFVLDHNLHNILAVCPEDSSNEDSVTFFLCKRFPAAFPKEISAKIIQPGNDFNELEEQSHSLSRVIVLLLPRDEQAHFLKTASGGKLWEGSHIIIGTTFDGQGISLPFIEEPVEEGDYRYPSPVFLMRTLINDPRAEDALRFQTNFRAFGGPSITSKLEALNPIGWRGLFNLHEFVRSVVKAGSDMHNLTGEGCHTKTLCNPIIKKVSIDKVMPDGILERFVIYEAGTYRKVFDDALFEDWWLGAKFPPDDVPACLYCTSFQGDRSYVAVLVIPLLAFLTPVAYITWNREKLMKSEQTSKGDQTDSASSSQFADWNIKHESLIPISRTGTRSINSFGSSHAGSLKNASQTSRYINDAVMNYHHMTVWVSKRELTHHYDPSQRQIEFLTKLKQTNHSNLATFFGLCLPTDPQAAEMAFVLEYCNKGSLFDLIAREQTRFNMELTSILIRDIVAAMTFVHQSFLFCHGSLKSPNCLITSRFNVKITDHLLRAMPLRPPAIDQDESMYRKMLWSAPEILRGPVIRVRRGTREGDVYSFGIILQEILMQSEPFRTDGVDGEEAVGRKNMTPKEIVRAVIQVSVEPFRPTILHQFCPLDWYRLMQTCWAECPEERPTFKTIGQTLPTLSGFSNGSSYLEYVLHRMEQYQMQLEQRVGETTMILVEEKRRSDELLAQMMPRSVIEEMQKGKTVMPEAFDFVTLAFTAVIDFALIAHASSPIQIVLFLNTLYSTFDQAIVDYDVYKVETIQDSYFIASGLPLANGTKHVNEIGRVSLKMLNDITAMRIEHMPNSSIEMKIGIHTGPCVAGVIGLKAPRYCIFGDTVNTTSRMCSTSEAQRIQISDNAKIFIDAHHPRAFFVESRGTIEVKGKGHMRTYFLLGSFESYAPKSDA